MTGRVEVHFWGGPADGAVFLVPPEELPADSQCQHPAWPEAEYVLFRHLGTGRVVARYAQAGG